MKVHIVDNAKTEIAARGVKTLTEIATAAIRYVAASQAQTAGDARATRTKVNIAYRELVAAVGKHMPDDAQLTAMLRSIRTGKERYAKEG